LARNVKLTSDAAKYLEKLDKKIRRRIADKLKSIADDPFDLRLSYPLKGTSMRSTRIGDYRVLFEVFDSEIVVAEIGPRGQIYRKI